VRTPVLLACDAADESAYMEERFRPDQLHRQGRRHGKRHRPVRALVSTHGALTAGVYSTRPK
jgi:hypothetical protein